MLVPTRCGEDLFAGWWLLDLVPALSAHLVIYEGCFLNGQTARMLRDVAHTHDGTKVLRVALPHHLRCRHDVEKVRPHPDGEVAVRRA